jgi:hypothetical protein
MTASIAKITFLAAILSSAVVACSSDVHRASDRTLMWETASIDSGKASTPRAVAAAKRFFDGHDFVGKTRHEIIAVVGDPKTSSNSHYNFPFYRVPSGVLTYRFDTGHSGWQFDIVFGPDGRATSVTPRGIE